MLIVLYRQSPDVPLNMIVLAQTLEQVNAWCEAYVNEQQSLGFHDATAAIVRPENVFKSL